MPYDCVLKPGKVARIPLGFGLIIPDGFAGYVFPRSSMAAKDWYANFHRLTPVTVVRSMPLSATWAHLLRSFIKTHASVSWWSHRLWSQTLSWISVKNEELGLLEAQENNTMITFGRKLKHLRQKNHLTQKELGMAVDFLTAVLMSGLLSMKAMSELQKRILWKSLHQHSVFRLNSLLYRYSQNLGNMRRRSIGGMS